MNNTATPVFRPTADCIWNSFLSSGKKRICLTGGTEEERQALLREINERGSLEAGFASGPDADTFLVNLDAPYGNTACVIMASGLGRRFGGNKLTADFRGEPMIKRILAATDGIFTRRVVVTRHADVAALCESEGIDVLLHNLPHRSDTVRLGLEAAGDADMCVFCPGDQPLLRRETVAALVLAAANDPSALWRTAFESAPGSPVCFPRRTFGELGSLPEGKGGGHVIKKYPERLRLLSVRDQYELMDVDRPEDLAELAKR